VSGAELVRDEVLRCLREKGVAAVSAYESGMAAEQENAVIAVGIRSCESAEAGMGAYLGELYDETTASWQEQYGRKMDICVALDAYGAEKGGAQGCEKILGEAHDALFTAGITGIRWGGMQWGEAGWDRGSGMFLQQAQLRCSAYFIAAVEEETGVLLSFRLKGVPEV